MIIYKLAKVSIDINVIRAVPEMLGAIMEELNDVTKQEVDGNTGQMVFYFKKDTYLEGEFLYGHNLSFDVRTKECYFELI